MRRDGSYMDLRGVRLLAAGVSMFLLAACHGSDAHVSDRGSTPAGHSASATSTAGTALPDVAAAFDADSDLKPEGFDGFYEDQVHSGSARTTFSYTPPNGASSIWLFLICSKSTPVKVKLLDANDGQVAFFGGQECTQYPEVSGYKWPLDQGADVRKISIESIKGTRYELSIFAHQ